MSRYELPSHFCEDMGAALARVSEEGLPNNCENVEQVFQQVSKYDKMKALTQLLEENDGKRVLVFVEKNRNADFIAIMLSEQQKLASSVHLGRSWRDKQLARKWFKSGHHKIMVATSALVCGFIIKDVDMVINYDLPTRVDEYVHRIERTGRVGRRGKAVSFFDIDHDAGLVVDLIRVLRQANQPLPDFFAVGGSPTCQVPDAMAVTSELSTAEQQQLQCPTAACLPCQGAQELVMTPHGLFIYWCCFRTDCPYYKT